VAKQCFPAHPEVPISQAVRAGDFVFTSAYGPWLFDPKAVSFDAAGQIVDDGSGKSGMPFADQVHATIGLVTEALAAAGCELGDVVDCQVWLASSRDFVEFNAIYRQYFSKDPPVRSVFEARFLFMCKLEMKVVAYKPLATPVG
jgi:enamine deaminase RidA (YjgF/YER057c/UK114 family)